MIKGAVIGFGGLGKLHFSNLMVLAQGDFEITALCGVSRDDFEKTVKTNLGIINTRLDSSKFNLYTDAKVLIDTEKPDFIVSALPTYLHEEIALYALSRGCHVFSEKPMAATYEKCCNMVKAAKENKCYLMIGQCLRFDKGYTKIKEYIDNNTFGKVLKAEFGRYSQLPKWTWNDWILDFNKSGGCAIDMHIHDVDLISWMFGMPESVSSVATHCKAEYESIFTRYEYNGKIVMANADWGLPQKYPFKSWCTVVFENAAIEYNGELFVYTDNDVTKTDISGGNYFLDEMKEFIACIKEGRESSVTSAESVRNSIYIASAEIKSSENEGEKVYLKGAPA